MFILPSFGMGLKRPTNYISPAPPLTNTYSILFEGTNDVVSLGQPADLTRNLSNTEFTVSAWVYPTNISAMRYITAKAEPFAAGGGKYAWTLGINTDGTLFTHLGAVAKTTQSSISAIAINNWYHALVTVINVAGTYTGKLYLNGVQVGSNISTPGTETGSGIDVRIGAGYVLDSPNTLFPYIGYIDEVSYWSAGFTAANVTAMYNGGKPTNLLYHAQAASLLHWYRMGDGDTYPTVLDNKGSSNGTMTNMAGAGNIVGTVP